jgi:hypothetical protein
VRRSGAAASREARRRPVLTLVALARVTGRGSLPPEFGAGCHPKWSQSHTQCRPSLFGTTANLVCAPPPPRACRRRWGLVAGPDVCEPEELHYRPSWAPLAVCEYADPLRVEAPVETADACPPREGARVLDLKEILCRKFGPAVLILVTQIGLSEDRVEPGHHRVEVLRVDARGELLLLFVPDRERLT